VIPNQSQLDKWRQPELSTEVHRGIKLNSRNNYTVSPNLGTHWSTNPEMAALFSGLERNAHDSIVFHGEVPISSVEGDKNILKENGVRNFDTSEKEVPVKQGSPVKVTGISKFRDVNGIIKERKRSYNPPREMKA
jgi:hypothetical protein